MRVAATQCETCIYRPGSPLDLKSLEAQIADPNMAGFFNGHLAKDCIPKSPRSF